MRKAKSCGEKTSNRISEKREKKTEGRKNEDPRLCHRKFCSPCRKPTHARRRSRNTLLCPCMTGDFPEERGGGVKPGRTSARSGGGQIFATRYRGEKSYAGVTGAAWSTLGKKGGKRASLLGFFASFERRGGGVDTGEKMWLENSKIVNAMRRSEMPRRESVAHFQGEPQALTTKRKSPFGFEGRG